MTWILAEPARYPSVLQFSQSNLYLKYEIHKLFKLIIIHCAHQILYGSLDPIPRGEIYLSSNHTTCMAHHAIPHQCILNQVQYFGWQRETQIQSWDDARGETYFSPGYSLAVSESGAFSQWTGTQCVFVSSLLEPWLLAPAQRHTSGLCLSHTPQWDRRLWTIVPLCQTERYSWHPSNKTIVFIVTLQVTNCRMLHNDSCSCLECMHAHGRFVS